MTIKGCVVGVAHLEIMLEHAPIPRPPLPRPTGRVRGKGAKVGRGVKDGAPAAHKEGVAQGRGSGGPKGGP